MMLLNRKLARPTNTAAVNPANNSMINLHYAYHMEYTNKNRPKSLKTEYIEEVINPYY